MKKMKRTDRAKHRVAGTENNNKKKVFRNWQLQRNKVDETYNEVIGKRSGSQTKSRSEHF